MTLNEKVKQAVGRHEMLTGAKKVIVAYSGGADSSALLWWLCANASEYGATVEAFHLNHGIRGDSADRDERFCRLQCEKLGVYFESARLDVLSLAREWKCGVEEAGRRARYAALEEMRSRRGADRVATAHHADDNLETVIFNLARGAGERGLGGIPPVRGRVIRPLIACTREEISAYVRENEIPFVDDLTNAEDRYRRNFIRHNVVPALRELNPRAAEAVLRTSELVRRDDRLLCDEAENLLDAAEKESRLPGRYSCRPIGLAHPSIGDRAVAAAARKAAEDGCGLSGANLCAAAQAVRLGADCRLSVGNGLALDIYRGCFAFLPDRREPVLYDYEFTLSPGVPVLLPTGMTAALLTDRGELDRLKNIHPGFICTSLDTSSDENIINSGITVRSRRPGDRLRVRGLSRTVKNLMQEAGVPANERASLPVFCACGVPVWIPRVAAADGVSGNGCALCVWDD